MSLPSLIKAAGGMFAERWQIPVAIGAVAATAVTLSRLAPAVRSVPFDALVADVVALRDAGEFRDAADSITNLLFMDPPLPAPQRAELQRLLAQTIHDHNAPLRKRSRHDLQAVLESYALASAGGAALGNRDRLCAAQAQEWLGRSAAALDAYQALLGRPVSDDIRLAALRALVRLTEDRAAYAQKRRVWIEDLLAADGVDAAFVWWTLRQAVREALERAEPERAERLLSQHAARFQRSDLRGYYEFLWAWLFVERGETERAWALIDWVDEWLATEPGSADLEQAGQLLAMNRWLRGRASLSEARPQEALKTFEEVASLEPPFEARLLASAGRAEALAGLDRHDAARMEFRAALGAIEEEPQQAPFIPRLRRVLRRLSVETAGPSDAVAYLELALDLTPDEEVDERAGIHEALARLEESTARSAADPQQAADARRRAALHYEAAGEFATLDQERHGGLLWAAAEQYDLGGFNAEARRVLDGLLAGRADDPRLPHAMLQLAEAHAAEGRLEDAIQAARKLIDAYPHLNEALRARLLMAECLIGLGEEHWAAGERVLLEILNEDRVAPSAKVYHDAQLALCDLYYLQERFAEAISRLEDFTRLYPQDPDARMARFTLADAYRRSAYALRNTPEQDERYDDAQEVSRARFRRSAELFRDYSTNPGGSLEEDREYARLALFYRADSLFELNEPPALDEALATYQQLASQYQSELAALSAQVQVTNILLRQGKPVEAARALERARWMLRNLPPATDEDAVQARQRWDRFLTTVSTADLFREVYASAPDASREPAP